MKGISRSFKAFFMSLMVFYGGNSMALTLTSSAFKEGESIAEIHTCNGKDHSLPLQWSNVPAKTQSFVLICDDPDAPMGTWDHWLVFNIPAITTSFPENMQKYPDGVVHGKNSWDRLGYGGPCPPSGIHRYYFKLYALDTQLTLPEGVKKAAIEKAMAGHILEQTQLMGRYAHKGKAK